MENVVNVVTKKDRGGFYYENKCYWWRNETKGD